MRNYVMLMCFVLAGCSSVESGFGGVADRFEAVLVGPARLYDDMAESDISLAVRTMQNALETRRTDETVSWINDETGNEGAITPRRTFVTDQGIFCREYEENLSVGGKKGMIENTACRTGESEWSWVA